jgi:hypothetical protein
MVRAGTFLDHFTIANAPIRRSVDWAVLGGFERPRLAAELGLWSTAAARPEPFPLYRTIDAIGPTEATRWLTVRGRIAPRQWFILDGWYSNPISGGVEGLPPTHSIVNATIQSRFLPTFRSGIFGLKLQGTMETWGTGVIGRDALGSQITLRGATLFRGQIQLQIGDFVAYYDRSNLQASDLGYLPGLPLPTLASTFGVRWQFSN